LIRPAECETREVTERLSALDVSFLYLETPTTPMHVGSVARFEPPQGEAVDYDVLCQLVSDRISLVPRYRQKVMWIPGHLANPVWVDDEDFDITYHVRRSALPKPGNDHQLRELVGRLQARQLDSSRPLWEIYLVEGLADGRFAIITKTHHAMVDGISAVDIGTVLLDLTPTPREIPPDSWVPRPEPSRFGLVAGAVTDTLRRPSVLVESVRGEVSDIRAFGTRLLGAAGGIASVARTSLRSAPQSPLNATIGE
jgi:WS/DGAT/MGAT family acyltransferase